MDNVIGTNQIGTVLGMDADEQQAPQDAGAAYDLALAQQIQEQLLLGAMLGATTPPKGPPPKGPPPKGPVKTAMKGPIKTGKGLSVLSAPGGKGPTLTSKVSQIHQQAFSRGLQNVQGAADHAKKVGTKTIAVAAAYNPDAHKPLAIVTHHGVHGILGVVHDSILGVTHAGLTPKQHAAVEAHNSAIARTHASATDAIKAGNRALAAGKAAGVTAKKIKPIFDKTTGKTGGAHGVHGIIGWDYPVIGVDVKGLSAGQQGYDPTTDPDSPQYAGGDQGAGGQGGFTPDPTLFTPEHWGLPSLQPLLTGLDGDNPDQNLTVVPPDNPYTDINGANPAPGLQPPIGGGTLSQADAKLPWIDSVPADGIVYTGPMAAREVGSYNIFYVSVNDGFLWFKNPGDPGLTWWAFRAGHGDNGSEQNLNSAQIADFSNNFGWGPLIGDPSGRLAGLQYSLKDNKWFWRAKNVPSWAAQQQNATIADANAKTLAAANAAVNQANQALRDANDATLKADNAAIAAGNANTTQLMNQMAEALLKQRAANELQQTADTAAEQHAASQQGIDTKAAQAKIDQETQQQQLDESTRASQLEADMTRAQQAQDAQEAQFEHQYALADQQVQAQLAPIQAQSDAQMQQALLQMLMQPPQPQGFDPSQMQGFDPSQMGGFDPSQMQGFDPSQMGGFDPSQVIDPTQIPGYFDASMYYGG